MLFEGKYQFIIDILKLYPKTIVRTVIQDVIQDLLKVNKCRLVDFDVMMGFARIVDRNDMKLKKLEAFHSAILLISAYIGNVTNYNVAGMVKNGISFTIGHLHTT